MLRVGCIEYINSLPLFAAFHLEILNLEAEIIKGTPSYLNDRLLNKSLDVSLVSSITYLQNKNTLKLIKPFGIAARGAVRSVNLYKRKDPLTKIGLTHESKTSVALLKILCKEKWKIDPLFEVMQEGVLYDGMLIIGDKALQENSDERIDLCSEWYEFCKQPFPFALLVARGEVETVEIAEKIRLSYEWSQENLQKIEEMALKQLPLSEKVVKEYFKGLTYLFSDEEFKGLATFESYL